jgi:hypothetical protein
VRFLQVRNWTRFQHYHNGRGQPAWLKLYTELQGKWEWMTLPDATKAHLVGLWMLAPAIKNRIPDDPQFLLAKLGATCSLEDMARSLELLKDPARGFLEEMGPGAAVPKQPAQLPLPGGLASNLLASPITLQETKEQRTENPPPPPRDRGGTGTEGMDPRAAAAERAAAIEDAVTRLERLFLDGGGVALDGIRRWRRLVRDRLGGGVHEQAIAAEISAENAERAAAEAQAYAHQQWLEEIEANGSRDAADRLWEEALELLEKRTNRQTYATWFRPLTPRGLHSTPGGPSLLLEAPNDASLAWLKSNYGAVVEEALQGVPVTWIVAPVTAAERGPPARAAPWSRAAR